MRIHSYTWVDYVLDTIGAFVVVVVVVLLMCSCATQPSNTHTLTSHAVWESYDQENLKRHDDGCPTAVFVAPAGELTQCQIAEEAIPEPVNTVRYFATMDAAALYIVGRIYQHSRYYEYGGVILKSPKGFMFAMPTTQHHGMDVSFDQDPESYEFPIVASYHVHPCLKNAFPSVFSPQDLAGARESNVPGYVLDECSGELHFWAPGDGYLNGEQLLKLGVSPMMLVRGVQLSPGKIVGKIEVTGEALE